MLGQDLAPMGPGMLSNTWAGVWRMAPGALTDFSSALDKFQYVIVHYSYMGRNLVGKRFAHQRFADSRESIRRKMPTFEALGQICMSSLRFALKFARFASNPRCYPIFWKVDSQKVSFFFEVRIDSQRIVAIRVRIANRFARIGALRAERLKTEKMAKICWQNGTNTGPSTETWQNEQGTYRGTFKEPSIHGGRKKKKQ